jgi:hypothetical protein
VVWMHDDAKQLLNIDRSNIRAKGLCVHYRIGQSVDLGNGNYGGQRVNELCFRRRAGLSAEVNHDHGHECFFRQFDRKRLAVIVVPMKVCNLDVPLGATSTPGDAASRDSCEFPTF